MVAVTHALNGMGSRVLPLWTASFYPALVRAWRSASAELSQLSGFSCTSRVAGTVVTEAVDAMAEVVAAMVDTEVVTDVGAVVVCEVVETIAEVVAGLVDAEVAVELSDVAAVVKVVTEIVDDEVVNAEIGVKIAEDVVEVVVVVANDDFCSLHVVFEHQAWGSPSPTRPNPSWYPKFVESRMEK